VWVEEYLDLASPVLTRPVRVVTGEAHVPDAPGFDPDWDEDAGDRCAADTR